MNTTRVSTVPTIKSFLKLDHPIVPMTFRQAERARASLGGMVMAWDRDGKSGPETVRAIIRPLAPGRWQVFGAPGHYAQGVEG